MEMPIQFVSENKGKPIELDSDKSDMRVFPVEGDVHIMGGDKKCVDVDNGDLMMLDPSVVDGSIYSLKRKRENLSGMLHWVAEIAMDSRDETIEKFMEVSKQKAEDGSHEFFGSTMVAQNAIFPNEDFHSSGENSPLQEMHPSMFENEVSVDHLSAERSRRRRRLSEKDSWFDHESSEKDASVTRSFGDHHSPDISDIPNPFDDDQSRQQVRVGQRYQAEVPEWSGMTSENDPKWLGTQTWPLIRNKQNSHVERDVIGKGRQGSCDCRLPGSAECVQFHIAEDRLRLKLELGTEVFYRWRFHHMGEEVSLQWTGKEEKKFEDIVRLNPRSAGKFFWYPIHRAFRKKSKETLISYYFNVFVLRRRRYQNRLTPNNIDSDDDESVFK